MTAQGNALGAIRNSQRPGPSKNPEIPCPERADICSFPEIPLIIFHPIPIQECQKLLLKRLRPMVFVLRFNVSVDLFDTGLAHRKGTVARLPIKIAKCGPCVFIHFDDPFLISSMTFASA